MAVSYIPQGYHSITPYLVVKGATEVIDFLQEVFHAQVIERMMRPDGTLWHAELQIGDSRLMLAEASQQWPARNGGFYLYVPDVDATYKRAVEYGAKSLGEPKTQFYGDRGGGVEDACGNTWWIATHIEDVSKEELERRAQEQAKAS